MAMLHVEFKSECLKRDVSVSVVLPFDRGGRAPYPTLYLLHGLQGNCNSWVSNTRIERWACERNLAVVMPQGENSFWLDTRPHGISYGDFGSYVGEELVQVTRSLFPLARQRERTFIGGFSMGGYGALRNGLKYPDTFGRIAAFSAAVHIYEERAEWIAKQGDMAGEMLIFEPIEETRKSDLNPRWLIKALAERTAKGIDDPKKAFPQVKIIVGQEDNLLESNLRLGHALEEEGAQADLRVAPGTHHWDFVQNNLEEMLDWLVSSETEHASERQLD